MADPVVEPNTEPVHTKRHYVIAFLVIFLLISAGLLFFLERTVGLETVFNPSAKVEQEIKLRRESANRSVKTRHYMNVENEITATLYDEQQRPVFLSIQLTFELQLDGDRSEIAKVMPIIVDSTQTYLRSIRPDELAGAQGIYRIREELLFRINRIITPVAINDVLFRDFSLQ